MKQKENWSPELKKAMEEARNFSKQEQIEINEKAMKSKESWLMGLPELFGATGNIMSGNSNSGSGGGY